MSFPNGAIEAAAISRMRGDTALQLLMTSTTQSPWNIFDFDGVLTNTPFPYIAAGVPSTIVGTAETMDLAGTDSTLQVSVFTQTGQAGGFLQARGIAKRVYDLFDRKGLDLSASGMSNFFLKFESAAEEPQQDGLTQHIPIKFKLMTQG